MNEVDGKTIAIGIATGTVVGFALYLLIGSVFLIYMGAIIGILFALGWKKYNGRS